MEKKKAHGSPHLVKIAVVKALLSFVVCALACLLPLSCVPNDDFGKGSHSRLAMLMGDPRVESDILWAGEEGREKEKSL